MSSHGLRGSLSPEVHARLLELTDTHTLRDDTDARVRVEEIARHLVAAGDARGLFSVVYRLITNRACASVREGAYTHEAWARQLIVRFATRYLDNLGGDLRGTSVTPSWQTYYTLARDPGASRLETLGMGILVHLMEDLPATLAEIGSTPEQEQDFMTFGEILLQVFPDLVRDVHAGYGVDAKPMLSGFAPGAWIDALAGEDTTTRNLYQAIRYKAWVMGQQLQNPVARPFTRLEVATSLSTMRAALGGLAVGGAI